jgi:4'-phosphopantetheinyl transferase
MKMTDNPSHPGLDSLFLWSQPPETLILENTEVHVWRAALDQAMPQVQSLLCTLTPGERARASRFHFHKDREHFIVARGLLRTILGRYLNVRPGRLRFRYSLYGKPSLAEEFGGDTLRFNVSHSRGLALYALTRDREIGVDLEYIDPDLAHEQIAERFFSPREVIMLRALPTDTQKEAFFNCWSRKEAYVKAVGDGLAIPLDQFDVSLAPQEPAQILSIRGDPQGAARWTLKRLMPAKGYVGALAIEGQLQHLMCWQWNPTSEEAEPFPERQGCDDALGA